MLLCRAVKIVDVPVPRIMEAAVGVVRATPQERVLDRTPEQILDVSVLRIMEAAVEVGRVTPQEHVQIRIRDQIVEVPAPLSTEKIVDDVFGLPQECVQSRATYTGKVFTVCHHFDDQACTVDIVRFIKGSGQVQHASTWRCYGACALDQPRHRGSDSASTAGAD